MITFSHHIFSNSFKTYICIYTHIIMIIFFYHIFSNYFKKHTYIYTCIHIWTRTNLGMRQVRAGLYIEYRVEPRPSPVLVQPHTTPYSIFSVTVLFHPYILYILTKTISYRRIFLRIFIFFFFEESLYFFRFCFCDTLLNSVFAFVTRCLIYSCSSVEYDTTQN